MDILEEAKKVFDAEIEALKLTRDSLDEIFVEIVNEVVACKGKVVMVGMGKPGHIARKIAATFSSLGTSSFYLNPAEAMHGDLGMLSKDDVVIVISYSGESDEIVGILPGIKLIGARIIAITGNKDSRVVKYSDIVQVLPKFAEACHLGLAPTASTTVELCYGDALAVMASEIYGFKDVDFGKYHPAGALGKKLIYKVDDLMVCGEANAVVAESANLKEAILQLTECKLGIVTVVNEEQNIVGVISAGDLGRLLQSNVDIYNLYVQDVMHKNPKTIPVGSLAVEALNIMKKNNIYSLPVIDGKKVVGTICMNAIISEGISDKR